MHHVDQGGAQTDARGYQVDEMEDGVVFASVPKNRDDKISTYPTDNLHVKRNFNNSNRYSGRKSQLIKAQTTALNRTIK